MSSQDLQAQQPSADTLTATSLFETQFDGPPPGPATISVATIALAPGQASFVLEGLGSLLILVESGNVTLLIDHAIEGLAPVEEDVTASEPEVTYHLRAGQRVTIPTIGKIQFRNEDDQPANLLLISLVSEGGPSLPVVAADNTRVVVAATRDRKSRMFAPRM